MAKLPSPQYWNPQSSHNNLNSNYEVFGKNPDRETDNIVDDKTTIPIADATKAEGEDEDAVVQVKIDDGT